MRAKDFILEYKPEFGDPKRFKKPEEQLDAIIKDMIKQGIPVAQAREEALDWLMHNKSFSNDVAMGMIDESIKRVSEGDVLPFKRPHAAELRTDQEKYDDALGDQSGHRPDVGIDPCQYCGNIDCDFDCDESQADGFSNDVHSFVNDPELDDLLRNAGMRDPDFMDEGSAENAKALVGSGRGDPHGKKTNPDSAAHKKVRTPSTTYSKDRKKYNNGAKPGANDGFVGE